MAVEFNDTDTRSLQTDLSGSVGANAGFAKSDLSSRLQSTSTSSSQVLRKSLIQSTFRELYDFEQDNLVLSSVVDDQEALPRMTDLRDISKAASAGKGRWVIDAETLRRGGLVEVTVEMEAEEIYRYVSVFASLLEIMKEFPDLNPLSAADLANVTALNRVLDTLLVGLIPVRGRVLDYQVLRVEDRDYVVHRRMLDDMQIDSGTVKPLYVVGVTEQKLFWKDIRRVLFSRSEFRVLCRIGRSGVQDSWTPVKLVDVVEGLIPDLADSMRELASGDIFKTAESAQGSSRNSREVALRAAATRFAMELEEAHGATFDAGIVSTYLNGHLADAVEGSDDAQRRLFNELVKLYEEANPTIELDRAATAQSRVAAMSAVGFDVDGVLAVLPNQAEPASSPTIRPEEAVLDTEIIAIYW